MDIREICLFVEKDAEGGTHFRVLLGMTTSFSKADISSIISLYVEQRHSIYMISQQHHVRAKQIRSLLQEAGIRLRPKRALITPEEVQEMARLYREGGLGTTKIARMFDSSGQIVSHHLRKIGVLVKKEDALTEKDKQEIIGIYNASSLDSGDIVRELMVRYQCSEFPIRQTIRGGCDIKCWDKTMQERNRGGKYVHIPRKVYDGKRSQAIKRGNEWKIDIYDIERCYDKQGGKCYYTGLDLVTASRGKDFDQRVKGNPRALSIDRIDSAVGYTTENIALCCMFINYAKNAWSESEFRQVLREAAESIIKETPA